MERWLGIAVLLPIVACSHTQSEPARGSASLPAPAVAPFEHGGSRVPAGAYLGERDRCVDRELRARRLNEFGDPEGTTYSGGLPLGVTSADDRHEYVMRRRPEIGAACTRAPGEPER